FPSSRRFHSPLYLRIEDVPGFDPGDPVLAEAAAAGRALNRDRIIDRDEVHRLKRAALERLWVLQPAATKAAMSSMVTPDDRELAAYAAFCAMAEHHGIGWPSWPGEHRRPENPGVERFAN